MSNNLAPITLFVYNRIEHTSRALASLLLNPEAKGSDLFVYSDGPRNPADHQKIAQVRELFRDVKGFKSVTLIERPSNFGLAENIIDGVSFVCNKYGKVIVLEDDLVLSPYFLKFMNDALQYYCNTESVGSIHGYLIPTPHTMPETFFLRGADCWGWATWKRSWCLFEKSGINLLSRLNEQGMADGFDMNGLAGNLKMLSDQIKGKNNSWAIRWHASLYLANKLTLYPGTSLVNNIGIDHSGEHCVAMTNYDTKVSNRPINIEVNTPLVESPTGRAAYQHFYKSLNPPFFKKVFNKIKKIVM